MAKKKTASKKTVATFRHEGASRTNIPTAEFESVMHEEEKSPVRIAYERRNRDLDPQLVWRGKDEQDWSDLVVHAPPLYIQEKIHPKVLIDDLVKQSAKRAEEASETAPDLFADFNGFTDKATATEFYKHAANWTNRMILGDSLHVMASLAEREGLRGKVQCIYIDPPYGIKFNSNFQWSTTSRDVKDGNAAHITREPEQVKAFRDTWREGVHSYLTYLRDRLTVALDLLADSGSVFLQIGDENVHRVRVLLDEVFGDENAVSLIAVTKTSSSSGNTLSAVNDYVLWYCKNKSQLKYRQLYQDKELGGAGGGQYTWAEAPSGLRTSFGRGGIIDAEARGLRVFRPDNITSQRPAGDGDVRAFDYNGKVYSPGKGTFKTDRSGLAKLARSGRLLGIGNTLCYVRFLNDFPVFPLVNSWADTGASGFGDPKIYIVQTLTKVIERCVLMTTDPGDLVLDPTCGSGTTAYVAEQWGRRWITIDTSRVALALARARLMGARYEYYYLSDSAEGQKKEAEVTGRAPSTQPTHADIRHGFVYERVPHITLKSIANNAEIDVIHEKHHEELESLRAKLHAAVGQKWEEWEIPREADVKWKPEAKKLHAEWWGKRIARQKAIDTSISAKADQEFLWDRPYSDKSRVRVAGPFTVESLSPHRILPVDEEGTPIEEGARPASNGDFAEVILEQLRVAGVQQAHKEHRIAFDSLVPWPGDYIAAEGRYSDADGSQRSAGVLIGPEFGTVSKPDLVAAAREAGDAGFDVLIACAFNFDAHSTEFEKLGRIPILKARMNADLHMASDLKNTGQGNLFVVFGEPEIDIDDTGDGQLQVRIKGVDVFHPQTGQIDSTGPDGIACWFIDTDYNEESFFVRQAYFLGASDPYKSLRTTLKAEIDADAWESLHSDVSRPFPKPESGRIAVKVINHLGDEVMKVYSVS